MWISPERLVKAALAHVVRYEVEAANARSGLFEVRRRLTTERAVYRGEPFARDLGAHRRRTSWGSRGRNPWSAPPGDTRSCGHGG